MFRINYRLLQDTLVDDYSCGERFIDNPNVVFLQSLNHIPGGHKLCLLVQFPISKGFEASVVNTPGSFKGGDKNILINLLADLPKAATASKVLCVRLVARFRFPLKTCFIHTFPIKGLTSNLAILASISTG